MSEKRATLPDRLLAWAAAQKPSVLQPASSRWEFTCHCDLLSVPYGYIHVASREEGHLFKLRLDATDPDCVHAALKRAASYEAPFHQRHVCRDLCRDHEALLTLLDVWEAYVRARLPFHAVTAHRWLASAPATRYATQLAQLQEHAAVCSAHNLRFSLDVYCSAPTIVVECSLDTPRRLCLLPVTTLESALMFLRPHMNRGDEADHALFRSLLHQLLKCAWRHYQAIVDVEDAETPVGAAAPELEDVTATYRAVAHGVAAPGPVVRRHDGCLSGVAKLPDFIHPRTAARRQPPPLTIQVDDYDWLDVNAVDVTRRGDR